MSKRRWFEAALIALVLFGLGLSFLVPAANEARQAKRADLEADTDAVASGIRQTLDVTVANLASIGGLFRATDEVTGHEMDLFGAALFRDRLREGVAVALWVTPEELPEVTAQLQVSHGAEPYQLGEGGVREPLGDRDAYLIITHQYGLDDDSIVGVDYAAIPSRAEFVDAMIEARTVRFGPITDLIGLNERGFPVASPILGEDGSMVGAALTAVPLSTLLSNAVPAAIGEKFEFTLADADAPPPENLSDLHTEAVVTWGQRTWILYGESADQASQEGFVLAGLLLALASLAAGVALAMLRAGRTTRRHIETLEEERRAEAAYRTTLEQFEILASNATDMVTTTDADGICLYVSPSSERLLGFEPEDLEGRSVFSLIHPADRHEVRAKHASLFHSNLDTVEAEFRMRHADGTERWYESVSRLVIGEAGVEVQSSTRDITDKVVQREELDEAIRTSEATAQTKAQFIANISHEIRTPLNSIIGMTDLALASDLSGAQRDYLQVAKSSARALLTIVNDVLDLTKAASGRMELVAQGFSPRDLFSDTIRSFEPEAARRNLELILAYDDRMAGGLWGDPGRIRQILVNLVGNALKFTHTGGVTVTVTRRPMGGFRCAVADTGIGIPPGRMEAIFDDFTQAEATTTQVYGGTGLGLGISRRLVEMMGGTLRVTSEQGHGSTFTFDLPLPEWDPVTSGEIEREVVFVIEPTPKDVDSIEALVTVGGRTARPVGLSDTLGWERPVVAVLDGPDDTAALEICRSDAWVLVVDAAPQRGNSKRFREMGAAAYIGRPAEAMELLDLLDAVEQRRGEGFVTRHDLRDERPSRRVLIADDVATNRLVVEQLLTRRGHEVSAVANGLQALEVLEVERFDIVLMDVQMPVMDGLTATRRIRHAEAETGRRTPIIALTGRAMESDRQDALDAGCDGYMTKPFDPHELCITVERLATSEAGVSRPAGSQGALDLSVVEAHTLGDPAMTETLLDTARMEIVEQRAELDGATGADVTRPAHKLKGMLGMIGAMPASRLAALLEDAGRRGDELAIARCLEQLDDALAEVAAAIDTALTGMGPADLAELVASGEIPTDQ